MSIYLAAVRSTCRCGITATIKVVKRLVVGLAVKDGDVVVSPPNQMNGAGEAKHARANNDDGGCLVDRSRHDKCTVDTQ